MVVKKELDCKSNGFQVPFVPRGPRSTRVPFKKRSKDHEICAIELLASLAGKLLQENDNSSPDSNSLGSFGNSTFKSDVACENFCEKVIQRADVDTEPVTTTSDYFEKAGDDGVSVNYKIQLCRDRCGSVVGVSPIGEACVNVGDEYRKPGDGTFVISEPNVIVNCSMKVPMNMCDKFAVSVDTNSDAKAPFSCIALPPTSTYEHVNNVKLGFRDDDGNLSRCHRFCTKRKALRPPQHIAHRRIRKLLHSKYWKVIPELKNYKCSRSDMGVKHVLRKRKAYCSLKRFHRVAISKRMKLFGQTKGLDSDGGFSSDFISTLIENETCGHKNGVHGRQASFNSHDSHVKFSIRSFKVPDLYVEMPETSTVGSLKRTVMETVMALLGGEFRVGVLHRGKNIQDDNKTLLQTGIAHEGNLDTVSFTLEPSSLQAPVDPISPSFCKAPERLTTSPGNTVLDSGISEATPDSPSLINASNPVESNQNHVHPHSDTSFDIVDPDSRALIVVPERNDKYLPLVPTSQKTRSSDNVQRRRIRRPFSVAEVQALVTAVEELGAGRWRDVKVRAFENADHRTYVDLKDKWKTLVHTAKIAPQQRRGQPVPEELLNRVLAAHTYWSQHQAKQHEKHQAGTLRTGDSSPGKLDGGMQLFL